jgi:hypothetical protein
MQRWRIVKNLKFAAREVAIYEMTFAWRGVVAALNPLTQTVGLRLYFATHTRNPQSLATYRQLRL